MKRNALPPLSLLQTFEVVARHLSFTRAAGELCLTQSAVSRQIRQLEQGLGVSLFRRLHRAIELTAEGRRLFDTVSRGLAEISDCVAGLRAAAGTPQITVSASVAFSYFWLMPRLERFSARHPDIDLQVLATDRNVDLHHEAVDVAVLYGRGGWDGVAAHRLFGEQVCPVCSPAYLRDHPELRAAADLPGQTLLHLEGGGNIWGSVDWRIWLLAQGVSSQPARRGVRMNSYPMIIQAAEAGRGVALGWSYITDPMLADGRLVCPVGGQLETGDGYYIGASDGAATTAEIAGFIDWVRDEAAGLA